jgi:hypothetical protein
MDATRNPTLADLAKRMDSNGKPARIIEILSTQEGILEDLAFIECNNDKKHVTTLRTSLPTPQARLFNRGTAATKSDVGTIEESCIMLEDWAQADADLVDKNGEGYRMSEHVAHIEGFNQEVARQCFYGNSNVNPLEEFMGFAPRYNTTADELSDYVIKGGGSGSNNTSIWLVGHGENAVHGIYPKGSEAGLSHRDLGRRVKTYTDSGVERNLEVVEDKYAWDIGLVVRDYRFIVRICNIDVNALNADPTSGGADLYELVARAQERIPGGAARLAFYGNRKVREAMRLQAQNKKNVNISPSEVTGKPVLSVDGIPFRVCDTIVNNEATIS